MTLHALKSALLSASKEDLEALSSKWPGPRDVAAEKIARAQLEALEAEAGREPSHAAKGAPSSGRMMGKRD